MSSFDGGRRASGRIAQAQEQTTAPLPIPRSKSTPRKQTTVSKRNRSASVVKQDYASSMPAPRLSGNLLDDAGGDDDDLADGPDGEVRQRVKGKKTKQGQAVYQCERCSKWYRHPACLIKHRWQHTEYWSTTSSMMMSKHQSVMMLEAAAILTNGSSLPESREYWPAAVSPPQSGLLGSEYLNAQTMRTGRSPGPGTSLTQQLMESESPSPEASSRAEEEDDMSMDEAEPEATGEDEGMFAFEMSLEKDNSSGGEADSGYASTGEHSVAKLLNPPHFRPTYPFSHQHHPAHQPYGGLSSAGSAPTLGFFERRQPEPSRP